MTDHQAKTAALDTRRVRLEHSLEYFLNQGDKVVLVGPSIRKLPGRWVDVVMLSKDVNRRLYLVCAVSV